MAEFRQPDENYDVAVAFERVFGLLFWMVRNRKRYMKMGKR